MKVGVTRERLEHELYKSLYEINLTRDNKNAVVNKLLAKGMPSGDIQQIVGGNTALEFLGQIRLGVVAQAIYEVTYNVLVNPENYYDKEELKRIKNYKEEIEKDEIIYPIIFENIIQQADDKWVGTIPAKLFAQLLQNNKLNYNFETQREPVYVKHKDGVIKQPNINPESVAEMTKLMIEGLYNYDDITFNILANGEEIIEYDEKNNLFKIVAGQLDLIDGAHRGKAIESALLVNPDITENFTLVLTNYDVDKANNYIVQKDKRNPLNAEFKEAKDTTNLSNDVVKRLNENTKSDMRGLIVTDEMLLKEGLGLTYFSIMSKTIDKLWDIKTRKDARDVSEYLIKFFNELVGIFPEELKLKIKENQGKNFINHRNIFIFYLTLAKELKGLENWEDRLYNLINSIDFSLENEYFNNTIKKITPNNIDRQLASNITMHKEKIQNKIKVVI